MVRRPRWKSPKSEPVFSVAKHIAELGDVLAVFNRSLKGFGKVFRNQESKIGIVRFVLLGFVGVAVYYSQTFS